jgi:hypothetical protein
MTVKCETLNRTCLEQELDVVVASSQDLNKSSQGYCAVLVEGEGKGLKEYLNLTRRARPCVDIESVCRRAMLSAAASARVVRCVRPGGGNDMSFCW